MEAYSIYMLVGYLNLPVWRPRYIEFSYHLYKCNRDSPLLRIHLFINVTEIKKDWGLRKGKFVLVLNYVPRHDVSNA